jgi:glyceraldehyde-3-phosphate dehydrogenase/erythrose-4-phosphate dehydrogenase
MSEPKIQFLEKELSELKVIISTAKQAIETKGTAEIPSILEKRIQILCEQLIKLPPKNAKQLGKQLPHLVNLLDTMASDLKKITFRSQSNKKTLLKKTSQAYQSTLLYKPTI